MIIHVDMDAFFASVEQTFNPFLRGKPVFVSGNTARDSVIAACSYEAKKYGVKSGMSIVEGLNMCPGAIIVRGNPEKYIDTSQRIFNVLKTFTEKVELYSIDEGFLEINPENMRHENLMRLGLSIKNAINKETSLTCSIGISCNKTVAKIASDLCKPDGIMIVNESEIREFMKTLPVEKVPGIGPKMAEQLNLMGIEFCGQIEKIPLSLLKKKFGVRGEQVWYLCHGMGETKVRIQSPEPKSFGHSYTLRNDTDDINIILSVLCRLSHQVGMRMRQESYYGNVVTVAVRYSDFTACSKRKTYPFWFNDDQTIFRYASSLIFTESIMKKIRLLGVSVSGIHKRYQMNLFRDEKRERMLKAMDAINEKYGNDTVFPCMMLYEQIAYPPVTKTHAFMFSDLKKISSGQFTGAQEKQV
ncbi:MAG TPA: DNA polymerase IV [bacterium]|nr:DNA polymerase IV [bacterium]HOL35402.1 DNA polymerase IV [bacterium]HPP09233.1 DNA polymerase IV [bacterium]